jgi:hypothetical protein
MKRTADAATTNAATALALGRPFLTLGEDSGDVLELMSTPFE